jgi:thiol-disulfide isomerase/thioredoxin
MPLETMEPNPVWVEDAYAETVDVFESYGQSLVFRVWGGDWCKDCRAQLPDFGAALDAAEVPSDNVIHYELDQDKQGPGVDEYDIELIPTVVVEHNGEEIARFVEEESVPIAVYLADEIESALGSVTDR